MLYALSPFRGQFVVLVVASSDLVTVLCLFGVINGLLYERNIYM